MFTKKKMMPMEPDADEMGGPSDMDVDDKATKGGNPLKGLKVTVKATKTSGKKATSKKVALKPILPPAFYGR